MKALFIIGHWNSGTTLLVDVLRKHPELKLKRARFKPNLEDRTIAKILRKMQLDFPDFGEYETINNEGISAYEEQPYSTDQLQQFRKHFLQQYGKNEKRPLLLKNPWLLFKPRLLQQAFSQDDVRYVFIMRDGRSQVPSKDYWLRYPNPEWHLLQRATFWTRCMEYFLEHWCQHPQMLTLRYETLCQNPGEVVKRICQHRQIDSSPLQKHLPEAFEVRMGKWQKLPAELQAQVWAQTQQMQNLVDEHFPI